MKPQLPLYLVEMVETWERLSAWERSEAGRAIRRLGWSYGEITDVIPVLKSTLANWCKEIQLSPEQSASILQRTGSRAGIPRNTQKRRHQEIERIRRKAGAEAAGLMDDSLWVAGNVMYWAEGAKSKRQLDISNSDPRVHRLFISWVRTHIRSDPAFVLSLHLHEGNDEISAKDYWKTVLDLNEPQFYKTYTKPAGTGHRKNHLAHGILRVRVKRSTDDWHRVMGWIDGIIAEMLVSDDCGTNAILAPGR